MDARKLLDIAAEYVKAKETIELAEGVGGYADVDLDEIAERFEAALLGVPLKEADKV